MNLFTDTIIPTRIYTKYTLCRQEKRLIFKKNTFQYLSVCSDYRLIAPFMRVKECGGNEYLKLFPEVFISGFWMVLTVSLPKSFTALIS